LKNFKKRRIPYSRFFVPMQCLSKIVGNKIFMMRFA
jgi:hypothetical protein